VRNKRNLIRGRRGDLNEHLYLDAPYPVMRGSVVEVIVGEVDTLPHTVLPAVDGHCSPQGVPVSEGELQREVMTIFPK
jgi:hypothetical protein